MTNETKDRFEQRIIDTLLKITKRYGTPNEEVDILTALFHSKLDGAVVDGNPGSEGYLNYVCRTLIHHAALAGEQELRKNNNKASMRENLIATAAARAGYMSAVNLIHLDGTVSGEDELATFCASLAARWDDEDLADRMSFDEFIESKLEEHYPV